jgi:hypothetical protein
MAPLCRAMARRLNTIYPRITMRSIGWNCRSKLRRGQFAKVSLIRRVDTTGGLLPSDKPCHAQHAGDQERVGYSATYLLYVTR